MKQVLLAGACALPLALALATAGSATVPGPNGLIAFRANTDSGSQLFTIAPAGTDQRQLTSLAGDSFLPHWSPESNRIVFEFDPANPVDNDFCNIATMNRNGGGLRILPLANGDACEASPTFSADGHRILYEGFDGVSRDAIFSMALNGKGRKLITTCQGQGVTDPEVSPDGTMLSFTCFSDEGQALFDEWLSSVGQGVQGYVTPKVAVAAIVANERGELLLTQRADSGVWLYPVGYADVGYSPSEIAVKEVYEETGIEVEPLNLIAVLDGLRLGFARLPLYSLLFHCRMIGGELKGHPLETRAVGFFGRNSLPWPVAGIERWGELAFAAIDGEVRPCDFDLPRTPTWRGDDS